ncbi:MAG: polysaccharide biosynthesis protein [Oscillospiraceae bacterium]|nr:polysaccharide biosynthesis protein [Clostridiales bacterium]MCD8145599.1 polysaccharide biosynthesis protein [Oscillospiraceae bacterium]
MMKKICFVSSSGGHWEELMCLKPLAENYDSVFVTEKGGQALDSKLNKLYEVDQINRKEKFFITKFLRLFIRAFRILRRENPDFIITTGALAAFPFCLWGKLLHKKVIYIESFARVEGKSLTGKLVYPFADLFIVQWPDMLKFYPQAVYVGGIF